MVLAGFHSGCHVADCFPEGYATMPAPLPLRHLLLIPTAILAVLPACQSMQSVGQGIQAGSATVARPVVSGSRKIASATVSGSKMLAGATVTGAKKVASGAKRIITFGRSDDKPAPAPQAVAADSGESGKPLPPGHDFPKTGLLVTDAELGPDATRLEATAVNLGGGWSLDGEVVEYYLESGASDPRALRVKGSPATATLGTGEAATAASANELHYHAASQVLVLKGKPQVLSGGVKLTATSPGTLIKIHLPSGAMVVDGPVRWGF